MRNMVVPMSKIVRAVETVPACPRLLLLTIAGAAAGFNYFPATTGVRHKAYTFSAWNNTERIGDNTLSQEPLTDYREDGKVSRLSQEVE